MGKDLEGSDTRAAFAWMEREGPRKACWMSPPPECKTGLLDTGPIHSERTGRRKGKYTSGAV